ncbi:hypothetical protein HDZ31DRAFT_66716 [Schizophyllum fasciatum]
MPTLLAREEPRWQLWRDVPSHMRASVSVRTSSHPLWPRYYAGLFSCGVDVLLVALQHCSVLDIISLRLSCFYLYSVTTQHKSLWQNIMRRICQEYEIIGMLYDIESMSIAEMQFVASIPERMVKRAKRYSDRHRVFSPRSFCSLRLPAHISLPRTSRGAVFPKLHILPGGNDIVLIYGRHISVFNINVPHGTRVVEVTIPCELAYTRSSDYDVSTRYVEVWTPCGSLDSVYLFVNYLRLTVSQETKQYFAVYELRRNMPFLGLSYRSTCEWSISRKQAIVVGNNVKFGCRNHDMVWFLDLETNYFGAWRIKDGATQWWPVGQHLRTGPHSSIVASRNQVLISGFSPSALRHADADPDMWNHALDALPLQKNQFVVKVVEEDPSPPPANASPQGPSCNLKVMRSQANPQPWRPPEIYDRPVDVQWSAPFCHPIWGTYLVGFDVRHGIEVVYRLHDFHYRKYKDKVEPIFDEFIIQDDSSESEVVFKYDHGRIFSLPRSSTPLREGQDIEPIGKVKNVAGHLAYLHCDRGRAARPTDNWGTRLRIKHNILSQEPMWIPTKGFPGVPDFDTIDVRLPGDPQDMNRSSVDFDPVSARYCFISGNSSELQVLDLASNWCKTPPTCGGEWDAISNILRIR